MKVLIACEFSGIVREAFKARGHDAWSCDLLPTEIPGQHYQGDVFDIINEQWDLMIAHPPCTYLCRNSAGLLLTQDDRMGKMLAATDFFYKLLNAKIPKICAENPVMHKQATALLGKYDQIIQPWQFGHDYSKKTCLWLKNLWRLIPTKIVELTYITTPNGVKYTRGWYEMPRTSVARSRTFPGIAEAMAEQWG
jgi:hypothetical protein